MKDKNQTITKEIVKEAMDAVSKDVIAPKCVRDGIVNQNQIVKPNKKVSSVEWLIEQITDNALGEQLLSYMESTIQQAKQMHEEEIMEAHYAPKYGCFSKQYYNDIYGDK